MKKIILSLLTFLIIAGVGYSQSSAGKFSLKNIDSYWESNIPASTFWIPKFRPFGNSTTLTDSTSYVTLNKGLYAFDSIKTDKDLIVKGSVVLDTNRMGRLSYVGNDLRISNGKDSANSDVYIQNFSNFRVTIGSIDTALMRVTHTGDVHIYGDLKFTNTVGTQQIKIPSDTASDYDGNDAITLNRQSGRLTTKSLTTTAGNFYSLTLTNSLITANSHVFVSWNDGTKSAGLSLPYQVRPSSGSCVIVIYNGHATDAFNGTMICDYVIFN